MTLGLSRDPSSVPASASPAVARAALVAVALGSLMTALDVTALNVALPGIGHAFAVGIDRLQWIAGAYTLMFASLLLATGSASDRLGARSTFVAGLVVFMGASIACGGAPRIGSLIAARAAQGLGAAIMLPSSMALLAAAYPDPARRARAIALWGGISAVGLVAGPVVGGLLCELTNWRAIFYLNAPFCLVAIGATLRCGERRAEHACAFDPCGVALSAAALAAITFALIEAPVLGWRAPAIVTTLAVGMAAACALVAVERRVAEPMLPPQLFASPAFAASVGVAFLQTFAYFGTLFVLPVALQVYGDEPLAVGLRLAPMTITTGVAATLSGRLAEAFGARRVMALGMLAGAVGALLSCLFGVAQGPFVLAALLLGTGGATLPLIVASALAEVPSQRAGIASGVVNAARQSGGVLGIACLGALMNNDHVDARLALLVIAAAFCSAAALSFARLYCPARAAASVEG
ncbi:drug resistance transporter, EmrB/QacA subfamily [Burkholderia sp. YR290]|uniref:MFS transporter n=1 Tax=Paraburkholderia hospita TaxID=169430 RepID=UPI0009A8FAA1|nr:MFS transporter [Paraburkholderia hospita]SKD01846.1 drug resistance transporter, EmrB/QacA subfamily [Paraburkholderia hospita]SOE83834.1 drug resistance transporter, EmrB/QacA subfamily [Burkholderia sp. YR290]